jgi:hypothetical protein
MELQKYLEYTRRLRITIQAVKLKIIPCTTMWKKTKKEKLNTLHSMSKTNNLWGDYLQAGPKSNHIAVLEMM